MKNCLFLSVLLVLSCDSSSRINQLQHSFDDAYRQLALPSQSRAAPIVLSRWDSLLRTYRLQLEETPARGEKATRQWRNLQHRLIILEQQIDAYRHRPSLYNLGGLFQEILSQDEIPLTKRLQRIQNVLQRSPAFYRQAKQNLRSVAPPEARLCVEKQTLGLKFLNRVVADSLQTAAWPPEKERSFKKAMEEASKALKQYRQHCAHLFKYSE